MIVRMAVWLWPWLNVASLHRTSKRGAVVKLSLDSLRRDALLFGESQSRMVLSVNPETAESVLESGIGCRGAGKQDRNSRGRSIHHRSSRRDNGARLPHRSTCRSCCHDRWAQFAGTDVESRIVEHSRCRHERTSHCPPDKFHDECAVFGIYRPQRSRQSDLSGSLCAPASWSGSLRHRVRRR